MMRTLKRNIRITCSILFLCCFINSINAQISNSSFENWVEVTYYDGYGESITYEKPFSWYTNQYYGFERLQKCTESTDGNYSLKFISSSTVAWGPGCVSIIYKDIHFTTPIAANRSLYLSYKAISLDNNGEVFFTVNMNLYQNNNFLNEIIWNTFEATISYTLLEIPLTEGTDKISIILGGGAVNDPNHNCTNISEILVDNLYIDDSTLSSEESIIKESLSIFPNPLGNELFVKNNDNFDIKRITLYNSVGREVLLAKENFSVLNVTTLKRGIYFVKIETEKGTIIKKIIKE